MSTRVFLMIMAFGFCFVYGQNSPYTFLNRTQQAAANKNSSIKTSIIDKKPGEIVSLQTLRDGTTKINKVDLAEMVDLIVEMKEEPLFIQQHKTSILLLQKSAYSNRFIQFRSDLGILHQSTVSSLKINVGTPLIKREFHKIFFGTAVQVPRAMISQIASLNYVKKVHVDVQVQALLDHSVHQIHADSVWITLGTQGDSIVVGILDTGIDYFNIALGGGFGPGYKVIDGYDFVNNDADPIDDYGHGTHVAGIVAANSVSLKGVAPHAKLMAFKVLDQYGSGSESTVLAGIERTADPNDDGNPDDMVDVVNMSLGGSGSPDDALSTAVDNAVKLGITFCIAAGNSYNNFTIGSPGTARRAITVGGVDENDYMASFSSKGPNSSIYSIKPEVVAPGVNILSTLPNNSSGRYSGTSMATPHVAGVCALLKSLHRSWTPSQIKSALMSTALDLQQEAMTQGAGRIDALKAAKAALFVIPSQLDFGLAGFTPIWTTAETLWVSNHSSVSQSCTMSFDNLRSGISIGAAPSSFSVAQNDSQQIIVTLSVDNSQVSYPTWSSLTYSGNVYIRGTTDTLHIPWAFVKASKVTVTFDQPYASFALANPAYLIDDFRAEWIDPYNAQFIAPEGTYDLFATFFSSPMQHVFKEGLNIHDATNISVSSSDANYTIRQRGVDQLGQSISSAQYRSGIFTFVFPDSSKLSSWTFMGFGDSLLVSSCSHRCTITSGEFACMPPNNIYNIHYDTVQGVHVNVNLLNRPEELYVQKLKGVFPLQTKYREINFIFWAKFTFLNNWMYFGTTTTALTNFTGEWNGNLYLNRETTAEYSCLTSLLAFDEEGTSSSRHYWFESAPFTIIHDSIGMFFGIKPPASLYLSPNGGTSVFGGALGYTDVMQSNNVYGISNIAAFPYFYGSLDELKDTSPYRATYSIYDSHGAVIVTDSLPRMTPIDVSPGEYRLEVNHKDYYVRDVQGNATLTTRFDLRKGDTNPPQISSLRLLNDDGLATDSLTVGEHATLIFSCIDYLNNYSSLEADSVKVYYRRYGTNGWNTLPITFWMLDTAVAPYRGLVFKADMTEATQFDSSGIDLKLVIQDKSANSTEWSLVPALSVGAFSPIVTVADEENKSLSLPHTFVLRQNYPNPFNPSTTIEFDIPHASFTTLEIFNVLGQKVVTILAENLQAGTHKIPWNASHVSSGLYFYKLNAGSFTETKKLLLLK
jgi:hypothetical protein